MCRPFGKLFYTGSYALDLMTWNDIDMQLLLNEGIDGSKALHAILGHIMENSSFIKSKIIRFSGNYKPKMPRGLYLGFHLDFPDRGGIWKFDLWDLEKKNFDQNRAFIEEVQKKMTPHKKQLILSIKKKLQQREGRMPQMGSHFLYQAVVLNDITSQDQIYQFLERNGIVL